MKQTITLAISAACTLAIHGCTTCGGDPQPCTDTPVTVTSLEKEYGCTDTRRQLTTNLNQTYTIIRNQADFDRLVTGNCHPQIDFTKYDLVIGKQVTTSGSSSFQYMYQRQCLAESMKLHVTVIPGMTTDTGNLTYHALVPKLAPQETVQVDVKM
ncbi:hypothetical protein [Hymenobacter rigui]|uniref:Uncharacterized protein n=1 Tax=Hymenobacter rigui TaxID=334424 RepID=A0A428KL13_9BACT|nr:hypothetical protein [Hymenobacter rigui]RSK47045.1 hypothetical protein EI291_17140 [Hymenobacter rigui]